MRQLHRNSLGTKKGRDQEVIRRMASTSRQRKPVPLGATGMERRAMAEHDAQARTAQQESTLRRKETGTR